jgi:spermidine/putrescine transport system permease protein
MKGRVDGLALYAACFVVFLYGPSMVMAVFSFNASNLAVLPLKGFTTEAYERLLGDRAMIAALRNSVAVGAASAAAATGLGLLAALAATRHPLPGKGAALGLVNLPLVVPSVVLGVALLVVVRRVFGLPLSLTAVTAGHVMLCTPFATAVLISRLEGFDRALEEASRDLGESAWGTFRRVTLPLAAPGIVASLLLCFTVSFDEFVLAFFLSGTDQTLPVFLYSQLRFPQRLPQTLALGTLILAASAVVVVLAERLRRRGARGGSAAV